MAEAVPGLGQIHRFDEVPSTLDVLHQLAEAGAAEGTVVVAAVQTAGRGRRGRSWASPLGGLWLSLLCRPTAPVALEVLSLRVGLRVALALESLGGALALALKWPNDLLLDGRKLGGILCETRWQGGQPSWVAIGVGLNVNNAIPPELDAGAIALERSLPGLTPAALVGPMVRRLQGLGGAGATLTTEELADFTRRDWLRGRRLIEPAAGVAAGVREDGALLVRGALGEELVLRSGHVVLAGP